VGVNPVSCTPADECFLEGACVSATGQCANAPVPGPGEIANVSLPDKTTIVWDAATVAAGLDTVYDVARGLTEELPVGSGAAETCIELGSTDASATDLDTPEIGACFWYLVRARNSCGVGSYGTTSAGAPRTTAVCP
jgi:hypothetical protein